MKKNKDVVYLCIRNPSITILTSITLCVWTSHKQWQLISLQLLTDKMESLSIQSSNVLTTLPAELNQERANLLI